MFIYILYVYNGIRQIHKGENTMNKVELIRMVAQKSTLTKAQAQIAIDAFIEVVGDSLKDNEKVSIKGFGSFEISQRKERQTKIPGSDTTVIIPSRKAPVFKASSTLKNKVNE